MDKQRERNEVTGVSLNTGGSHQLYMGLQSLLKAASFSNTKLPSTELGSQHSW